MPELIIGQRWYLYIVYDDPKGNRWREGFVRHNPDTGSVSVVNYAQEASSYPTVDKAVELGKTIRFPTSFSLMPINGSEFAYNDNIRIEM